VLYRVYETAPRWPGTILSKDVSGGWEVQYDGATECGSLSEGRPFTAVNDEQYLTILPAEPESPPTWETKPLTGVKPAAPKFKTGDRVRCTCGCDATGILGSRKDDDTWQWMPERDVDLSEMGGDPGQVAEHHLILLPGPAIPIPCHECDGDMAGACEHCPDRRGNEKVHWDGRQRVPEGYEVTMRHGSTSPVWSKR